MYPTSYFTYDPAKRMLRIVTSGHWSVDYVREYDREHREQLQAIVQQGCPLSRIVILVDTRGQGPQTQEVIAALAEMLKAPEYQVRRNAVLVSSSLLAMQSRRTKAEYGVFTDEEEAVAWLTAD